MTEVSEMVRALTTALQGLNIQRTPPAKLAKFRGRPSSPGEPHLKEWLEEFGSYAAHYQLAGAAKARALIDHLGGAVNDEIQCQQEDIRKDYGKIVEILQTQFARKDSLASLTQALHNRHQREGENLADFSRTLMHLHHGMVKTASADEKAAVEKLKENTLKECFVKGAREKWVQRELRQIQLADKASSFAVMRAAALEFFEDYEPGRRPRVNEVEIIVPGTQDPEIKLAQYKRGEEPSLREELNVLKKGLADIQQALKDKEKNQATYQNKSEVKCYNCGRRGHTKAECEAPTLCNNCKGKGHMSKDCPARKNQPAASPNASSVSTPAMEKSELVDRLVARSPCSLVKIGAKSYGCIFDTGAEASIIPSSLFNGQMREDLGEPKQAKGLFLNVVGVGGIEIPIEGFIEVLIEVNGQELRGSFLIVSDVACTVKDSKFPILQGCNVLRNLTDVSLVHGVFRGAKDKVQDPMTKPMANAIRIHTIGAEVFPPYSARRVVCRWGVLDGVAGESEVMIKSTLDDNPKVEAYEGWHQIKAGNPLNLLVANHTNREVRISPEMTVVEASPVIDQVEVLLEVEENNIVVSLCEVTHEECTVEDSLPTTDVDGVNTIGEKPTTTLPPGIKLDGLSHDE